MKELLRSNDLVLLSYIEALLKDAEVTYIIADAYISVMEGSIGALPRRILVDDDDWETAKTILQAAENTKIAEGTDEDIPANDDDK
ncbi:MAG: DUF2007 domain-containing protein [Alphaproteobacteria bacterium]